MLENLNSNNEDIWIGINRNIDGTFEWSSGDEVTFTDWAPGEPNTATYGKFGVDIMGRMMRPIMTIVILLLKKASQK